MDVSFNVLKQSINDRKLTNEQIYMRLEISISFSVSLLNEVFFQLSTFNYQLSTENPVSRFSYNVLQSIWIQRCDLY